MSLIFPTDLGSNAQSSNFMGFQAYTLTGGVGSAKSDRSYDISGNPVFLPIPVEGIQDQYQNSWTGETVNIAKMALGRAAHGVGVGVSSPQGLLDNLKTKMLGASTAPESIRSAMRDAWAQEGGLTSIDQGTMANQLLRGAAPFAVATAVGTLGNAVVQSSGIAGFEETSIAYQGPQFRSFSFNFSLKPLTQKEQITIDKIVTYFKLAAAPQELSGALYRIYSLPKVFEIKFYHKDGENHALPKISKCALQNIGIKYGGDRFQTFAADHAPIQTDISLQFIELVLQTQNTMVSASSNPAAVTAVDDFGAYHEAKVAENAALADAAAAANVDSFGGMDAASARTQARATATAVDDFGTLNASRIQANEFSTGSPMQAIKSKARGGASFIPDGGSG